MNVRKSRLKKYAGSLILLSCAVLGYAGWSLWDFIGSDEKARPGLTADDVKADFGPDAPAVTHETVIPQQDTVQ